MDKQSTILIKTIGFISLLIGGVAGILGPTEIYSYYLFSEGGRFYYEGFGFGSFLFGNISMQILGYYIIAGIFLPLGYGHVRMRSWIKNYSLALLWFWMMFGIPLLCMLLFMIVSYKEPTLVWLVVTAVFLIASYTVIPFLLFKFYQSERVARILTPGGRTRWIERLSVPELVTTLLLLFHIYVFHMLLIHKGLFPFFGTWLLDVQGFIAIILSIILLSVLTLGTVTRQKWASSVSTIYFFALTISTIVTLLPSSFSEIITILDLPKTESDALSNVPLNGFHLSIIVGLPLTGSWCTMLYSHRHFTGSVRNSSSN